MITCFLLGSKCFLWESNCLPVESKHIACARPQKSHSGESITVDLLHGNGDPERAKLDDRFGAGYWVDFPSVRASANQNVPFAGVAVVLPRRRRRVRRRRSRALLPLRAPEKQASRAFFSAKVPDLPYGHPVQQRNRDFHFAIYEAAHQPTLMELLRVSFRLGPTRREPGLDANSTKSVTIREDPAGLRMRG